jgi:hypothetical protein
MIEQYGIDQGLQVVDYHTALVAPDNEEYVTDLTVDGVHPSALGFAKMTPLVEAAIQAAAKVK